MITQETIDKINNVTKIEEVIGDFVELRRNGSNFKGCCPFHDEKTPSFIVSPAKGIFKCFGCGKAGNAITFIREHEKCSYTEALRHLANKYHIEVVETELTDEQKQSKDLRESLLVVNKFATQFFEDSMWNTPEGQSVGLSYFTERGFTEETIRKFHLGYSPQKKDIFTTTAEKSGYKIEYLSQLGLSNVGENYKIDRFHGRVIFPITNVLGTVIGFTGRVLSKANEHVAGGTAKYVNSPESEIYHKSNTLYGISLAKNEIVRKNECILVEGNTDVISLHQAEICNVVASSGTSLTKPQIDLIKRFTKNIVIIYDGDKAGIKAAIRGIDMILERDMDVRILLLPDGNDPDSFAQKHTSEEISNYIETNKTDFITFRTKLVVEEIQNDPIKRAEFINETAKTISIIPNIIKRDVFIQECSTILNVDRQSFANQVNSLIVNAPTTPQNFQQQQQVTQQITQTINVTQTKTRVNKIAECEKHILRILLQSGTSTVTITESNLITEVTRDNNENPTFCGLVKDYVQQVLEESGLLPLQNEQEQKCYEFYMANSVAVDQIANEIAKEFTLDNEFQIDSEKAVDILVKFIETAVANNYNPDNIVEHFAEFLTPEQVANVLFSTARIDDNYWEKSNIAEANDDERLASELKETLLEYLKRRYEAIRTELNKQVKNLKKDEIEQAVEILKKIGNISGFINNISQHTRHTAL